MEIIQLKSLRNALTHAKEEINSDWGKLNIAYDHWLSESLADLTTRIDENLDLVNQAIGELN